MTITYIDKFDELPKVYDEISEQFEALEYTDTLEDEVVHLMDLHQGFFDQEEDPNEQAWYPLADSTIAKKGHEMILFETGALESSLTEPGAAGQLVDFINEQITLLIFGMDIEYADLHMEDSAENNRPARPMVGVTDRYVDDLSDRIADATVAGLKPEKIHR